MQILKNNVTSRLASAISAGATSATVTAGDGAQFGTIAAGSYLLATLVKVSGYREVAWEVVKITARSTDTLTIARAQEGTTALAFDAGDVIDCRITAGTLRTGTATNDDAAAGEVGEYIEATVAQASAVALTSGAGANVTSISLTAGDWEVSGVVSHLFPSSTNATILHGSISATSATLGAAAGGGGVAADPTTTRQCGTGGIAPGTGSERLPVGPVRVKLSATTTIYLVAQATFTVSTLSAYGTIRARRVR